MNEGGPKCTIFPSPGIMFFPFSPIPSLLCNVRVSTGSGHASPGSSLSHVPHCSHMAGPYPVLLLSSITLPSVAKRCSFPPGTSDHPHGAWQGVGSALRWAPGGLISRRQASPEAQPGTLLHQRASLACKNPCQGTFQPRGLQSFGAPTLVMDPTTAMNHLTLPSQQQNE